MEYLELILGIILTIVFAWLLFKNIRRSSVLNTLFLFEIFIGVIAGVYLIVTSVYSLIF
jgi:hypothetical protein